MAIVTKVNDVRSPASRAVHVYGKVAIGGLGVVGAQTGRGFSIARTGAGLYTITIQGNGAQPILWAEAEIIRNAATGHRVTVLLINETTRTINLQVSTNAAPDTAADPPSGTSLQIHVVCNNVAIGQS